MRLRYFARYREMLGCSDEQIDLPEHIQNVQQLLTWLRETQPTRFEPLFSVGPVLTAVNEEMAHANTPICASDVVALFPPVTGG